MSQTNLGQSPRGEQAPQRSRAPLVIIFLLTLAPVLAAVLVYFNPSLRPDSSLAYGTIIDPQRSVPASNDLPVVTLDGQPFDLASLKGNWVLVAVDGGDCADACAK